MKKTILIVIAVVAGLALLGAAAWLFYFSSQFATFESSTYKFSIKYPREWKVHREPQPSVAAAFVSPKKDELDVFQENLNVTVQDVPATMASMETFSNTITAQMNAVFKNNIKILENKDIDISHRRGHRMVFEAPQPDAMTAVIQWSIKNDRAYIITFLGKTKEYQTSRTTFEEAINSFQFK